VKADLANRTVFAAVTAEEQFNSSYRSSIFPEERSELQREVRDITGGSLVRADGLNMIRRPLRDAWTL